MTLQVRPTSTADPFDRAAAFLAWLATQADPGPWALRLPEWPGASGLSEVELRDVRIAVLRARAFPRGSARRRAAGRGQGGR